MAEKKLKTRPLWKEPKPNTDEHLEWQERLNEVYERSLVSLEEGRS